MRGLFSGGLIIWRTYFWSFTVFYAVVSGPSRTAYIGGSKPGFVIPVDSGSGPSNISYVTASGQA